jgi:hypothetical protein
MKTKVIQISANDDGEVFGLGENNKVYVWDYILGQWQPYKL